MPFSYPPIQTKLYPTILEAQRAIRLADQLDERARDVRPLMAILMRMADSPRISGHITTRTVGLTSFAWSIKGPNETEADAAKERLEEVIDQVLENHAQVPLFGALCMELDWEPVLEGEKAVRPSIACIYRPDELEVSGGSLNVIETLPNGLIKRKPVKSEAREKVLAQIDRSYSAGGTLRKLLYQELLRHDTLQEWANFNKKLKGLIQGLYSPNATAEDITTAGDALKKLVEQNYAITSKELEFKLNEMAKAGSGQSFMEFKNILEADIAIAILGQANTAELPKGGGSRAALQVLNMIRADIHYSDQQRIKKLINRQLLTHDYRLNADPNAIKAPYSFDFIFDENPDIETYARAAEILARMGLPLDKTELYTKCGFTEPEDAANTFVAKTPSFNGEIGL